MCGCYVHIENDAPPEAPDVDEFDVETDGLGKGGTNA